MSASLVQTPRGYSLDPTKARACLIARERVFAKCPPLSKPSPSCALVAPNRLAFLEGLLSVWGGSGLAVLAPHAGHLDSFEEALPRVSFSEGTPAASECVSFLPEDLVCEVLTSGSTGTPERFSKTARQLFSEALTLAAHFELSSDDTVLATTATHHVYGLLFGALAPWASGAAIVAQPENEPGAFHPEKIAALVEAHEVTRLVSVPAHLRALLQAPVQLHTVRTIISSAAPLDPRDAALLEEKFGAEVIDILGSTETGGVATRRPSQAVSWTPLPGVRVHLDDDERLLLSSPFLSDPAFEIRSDERARLNEDGSFEYLGRADGVVKVGGKRISLQEIERVVLDCSGVKDCMCGSRPVSSLRGEELLLAVSGDGVEKAALRRELRAKLDPAFVPRKIRVLDALPRDERGKVKQADFLRLFESASTGLPSSDPGPVESVFEVPLDSIRFAGHFEGDALLPALAQLADIILPEMRRNYGGGALASLTRVKWTHAIRPGARLSLRLAPKKQGISFQLFEGETLACSGTARLHPESD